MKTLGLKNINMLTKEQYNNVVESATDELWAVETETYSDDDGNWYRVHPDGWCEQGGVISTNNSTELITFFKPFKNTQYYSNASPITNGAYSAVASTEQRTLTTMAVRSTSNTTWVWEAKGYIA